MSSGALEAAGNERDPTRRPTLGGSCRMCGQCCRAIALDFSKQELLALARSEADRLHRDPHTRHRSDIERLLQDVRFICRHFEPISRRRAALINPQLGGADFDGRRFYACAQLGSDSRCRAHARRPYVCEGYPWYYGQPDLDLLVVTPCGYQDS